MKIHRFYVSELRETQTELKDKDLIHQLVSVLRYRTGDTLHVFNEMIGEWEVQIEKITREHVSFTYTQHIKVGNLNETQNNKSVLYMSIIKNSNFDLVVEKAVELGIGEVVPVLTERTVKTSLNMERLGKIIKEATEQCGRVDLMKIGDVLVLHDAVARAKLYSEQVFFGHVNDANMNHPDPSKSNSLFIGPEGGWSDAEIELFKKENILPISLGQYVLRAETAAIVGSSRLV